MASYEYIGSGNITSLVAQDFKNNNGLLIYINQANDEVENMALSLGVSVDSIKSDPVHPLVIKYAVNYVYMNLYLDKMGTNNIDTTSSDKYAFLYNQYKDIINSIKQSITPEIISGEADEPHDFVRTVLRYRS